MSLASSFLFSVLLFKGKKLKGTQKLSLLSFLVFSFYLINWVSFFSEKLRLFFSNYHLICNIRPKS